MLPVWIEDWHIHTSDITKLTEHIFYNRLCGFVITTIAAAAAG